MITKFFKNNWQIVTLLMLAMVPAALRLLGPGFYEPSDLHHIADIYQMFRAFQSGQFPPRLGPDFTFGWGYPLFNFYYVLPFYLGALWFWIFGSLTQSYKFVFILSVIVSIPSMYLLLRHYFRKLPSFVGTVLYLYTPYRALEIYVRGAMGEALAISLLPLTLLVLVRILRDPTVRKVAVGGLVLALFLLSHNYLWLLSAPWMILFVVILLFFEKRKLQRIIGLAIAGVVGAGATIFWWLPALSEQKLVSSVTPFPLIDHFPFIKQLLVPFWGYGASVQGPGDGISFQIGIVNLAIFIISLGIIVFKKKLLDKKNMLIMLWAIAGFLSTVFMMNIRSYPIWQLFPFYNFVQFPWRLLFLTTLFTSVMATIVIEVLPIKASKILGIVVIITSIALTFNYFQPSQFFYKTDNQYLNRMFADRTVTGTKSNVSQEYLNWSEDYLLLPIWADQKPTGLPPSKIVGEKGMIISKVSEVNPVSYSGEVNSPKGGKITFFAYYFPGWYGKIDNKDLNLSPGKPNGQIEAIIPAGEHSVEFYWAETPFRKAADIISVLFILASLIFVFKPKRATL